MSELLLLFLLFLNNGSVGEWVLVCCCCCVCRVCVCVCVYMTCLFAILIYVVDGGVILNVLHVLRV